jgi:hypothetical protein
MSTGLTVAKKKQGPAQRPGPEKPTGDRVDSVRIRVSGAYKDWLVRFADAERSDMSDLIDDALTAHAKARGFEAPPKR